MTAVRSLLMAMVAVVLLLGLRPSAGDEQFPRGLMSAEPSASQSCEIQTRPLAFGAYDAIGTEVDAVGQVIYICTKSQAIRIEMARGASAAYSARQMLGPSFEVLNYNIYLDATHRTIWGDGTSGTDYYYNAKPPKDTPVTVSAFGRIDARQDVPAGTYHDEPAIRIVF